MLPARYSTPTRMFGSDLPAAAELVGAVLQAGARELHRADALVAEALVAELQVLPVARLGHEQQPARRALDRVADLVVAEHVLEAGLDLEHRAHERDGHAVAARLADDRVLVARARGAQRGLELLGPRRRVGRLRGLGLLGDGRVREVVAQLLGVRLAVAVRSRSLGAGERRGGARDRPERPHRALVVEPEHPAHAPERDVGVAVPLAVDGEDGRRAERDEVAVEVALQGCDVGLGALGLGQGAAADDGARALGRRRRGAVARELRAQLLLERLAVRPRARGLGRGLLGHGRGDQAERPDLALRLDPEDPAHALERELRVVVPQAVDGELARRAEPPQVDVEVPLDGRDVRSGPIRCV